MSIYNDLNELIDLAHDNPEANEGHVEVLAGSLRHFIRWALEKAGEDD